MDCFFAAVEIRDNPLLRGRPVVVGHDAPRGVVATASYEARKFGIHSAMPIMRAKALCPDLIIVPPRFNVYKEVSAQIREIFQEYTDIIEPLSLDEAYLDVTSNKPGLSLASEVARFIKETIKQRLHLTASAGISYCKFLAKIASDWRKPDGLFIIHPSRALDFIRKVSIEDFWGVGKVTASKMHNLGVRNGEDLAQVPLAVLLSNFGKAGHMFYNFARGIDNRPVITQRIRKSVSCEETLATDTSDKERMKDIIKVLAADLERRVERSSFSGCTFVLKVRFSDFKIRTRSSTFHHPLKRMEEFYSLGCALLDTAVPDDISIRLLGIGVSGSHKNATPSDYYQHTIDFGEDE